MSNSRSGFTLIEIMVVVIIIFALAGMVLPRVMPAADSAKAKIAKGDIANITVAIQLYRLHENKYPKSLGDLLTKSKKYGNESYLEKKAVDPWERAYEYKCPGSHGNFDIWSLGIDGQASDDDVRSWED